MNKSSRLKGLALALALIAPLATGTDARPSRRPLAARSGQTAAAKIEGFLRQAGYDYSKTGDNTWLINNQGRKPWYVLVATGTDFVVVGVVVAPKKNINRSADFMFKLLRLEHSTDYAKIGLDDDEDLFVRWELKTRLLDLQDFKSCVNSIVTASDTVYGEIKPFLSAP